MWTDREIDPDEGERRGNREAFYAEALPCESCGRPVFEERTRATWDENLLVGPCCPAPLYDHIPQEANCEELWEALRYCTSVPAVSLAMSIHISECPVCRSLRPEVPRIQPAYEVQADGTCVFPNRRKDAA